MRDAYIYDPITNAYSHTIKVCDVSE